MKTAVAHQRCSYPHEESTLGQQTFDIPVGQSLISESLPLVLRPLDSVDQTKVERLSAGGSVLFAAVVAMIVGVVLYGLNGPTDPRVHPGPSYSAQYSPYGYQTTARWVR